MLHAFAFLMFLFILTQSPKTHAQQAEETPQLIANIITLVEAKLTTVPESTRLEMGLCASISNDSKKQIFRSFISPKSGKYLELKELSGYDVAEKVTAQLNCAKKSCPSQGYHTLGGAICNTRAWNKDFALVKEALEKLGVTSL